MHRREVLRLLVAGSLLQLAPYDLFAVLREAHSLIQSQGSLRSLNAHQHATVQAMAEMIIPRTDTPGASDVGTAVFIDLILNTFDAIVVGSGITGGWAAKELTEKGLKTLVLEAGRNIVPAEGYVEHVNPSLTYMALTARACDYAVRQMKKGEL